MWGATSLRISGLPAVPVDMKEGRIVSALPPPPPPPLPSPRGCEGASSSLELAQPISVTTRSTRRRKVSHWQEEGRSRERWCRGHWAGGWGQLLSV